MIYVDSLDSEGSKLKMSTFLIMNWLLIIVAITTLDVSQTSCFFEDQTLTMLGMSINMKRL